MNKRIGFIGAGNMGEAIIAGLISGQIMPAAQISAFDRAPARLDKLKAQYGIHTVSEIQAAVTASDIIFIAVKPYAVADVLQSVKSALTKNQLLVSVATGVTIEAMEQVVGSEHKIIRAMPNTPALVNAGMSSLTPNANVDDEELAEVVQIFNSFGRTEVVPESMIHAVVGVSGSAPAYVFMFIEAMADAAVLAGMPRDQAYQFAAQAVSGSARMVLQTGMHPGVLKDMVCSPGGTTIEAVKVLEEKGLRAAVIEAVGSCIKKSVLISKNQIDK